MRQSRIDKIMTSKGIDNRGISWKPVKIAGNKVLIRFSNKYEVEYDVSIIDKYLKCKNDKNNMILQSNKTAYEFIGSRFKDKNNDEFEVIDVVKNRGSYKLSIVKIKYDDGFEANVKVSRIFKKHITKSALKQDQVDRDIELTRYDRYFKIGSYKGYCLLPEIEKSITFTERSLLCFMNMIRRCYSRNTKTSNNFSYLRFGVVVNEKWHNFYEFNEWYKHNYKPGYVLDKDLCGTGLEYSDTTCRFIPEDLNRSIISKPSKNNLPSGVYSTNLKGRKPYPSTIEFMGKGTSLGYYNTVMEAFVRYKICKEYLINKIAENVLNTNDEYDSKTLEFVKMFKFKDMRVDNNIKEVEILSYLRRETQSFDVDYFKLRKAFINKHKEYFDGIFDKLNKLVIAEYK